MRKRHATTSLFADRSFSVCYGNIKDDSRPGTSLNAFVGMRRATAGAWVLIGNMVFPLIKPGLVIAIVSPRLHLYGSIFCRDIRYIKHQAKGKRGIPMWVVVAGALAILLERILTNRGEIISAVTALKVLRAELAEPVREKALMERCELMVHQINGAGGQDLFAIHGRGEFEAW